MVFASTVIQNIQNKTKKIIIVDIEELSERDIKFVISNLAQIFDGRDNYREPRMTAKFFLDNFASKGKGQQHGLVAEFILTCILRNKNFNQEHCFKNLEEKNVKKGFDGLYSLGEDFWIAESKATYSVESHRNRHKTTIDRAYKGLSDQLSGAVTSNAWENAFNHSRLTGSKKTLTMQLQKLSEDHLEKKYSKIEENSIIIGSTVVSEDVTLIEKELNLVEKYITMHNVKNELLVVITMKSIEFVIDLFKELANE